MCGITGFVSPRPVTAAPVVRMNRMIRHRGPDDEGYLLLPSPIAAPLACGGPDTPGDAWRRQSAYMPAAAIGECEDTPVMLAFGHRRLSILDLSACGHQPMCTADRRYWIIYNGEVYNYLEVRSELEAVGYRFHSGSDTEVILAAWQEWGAECMLRFVGMWAFAIYDCRRNELFLARDRFGIKPLYYWIAPGGVFCFGSEIKQFTAYPGWRATVNPQRTYDFLAWGASDHTDETMFAGVYQLRPGHSIRLHALDFSADCDGRVPSARWYELEAEPFSGTFADAAAEFGARFGDAVRMHLRSDVAVGSCLSGGLDSSSIVCAVNRELQAQGATHLQQTFSACSEVARFDERAWIDEVVRATRVQAHYVYPRLEDLFEDAPSITWHQDEPFGSTSIYAQWSVFRLAARAGVNVMLDGQGADEHLAGYHEYFGPRFAGLFRSGDWPGLWHDVAATRRMHGYSQLHAAKLVANVMLPEALRQPLRARAGKAHATPDWLDLEALGALPRDPLAQLGAYSESVQGASRMQLTATRLQRLLHWEDRNSMAHSVESRVPFLDHRLVEFVLGLPDDFKIAAGVTKRVQRAGMSGVLPERIRDRVDKRGFETAEAVWMKEQAPDLFRARLREAIDLSGGLLRPDETCRLLEEVIDGRREFSFLPWRLINFGEWCRKFSVGR
jgi:asparagine synthase (glutamine-hydrolysing)